MNKHQDETDTGTTRRSVWTKTAAFAPIAAKGGITALTKNLSSELAGDNSANDISIEVSERRY